jgi:hypothetical protein
VLYKISFNNKTSFYICSTFIQLTFSDQKTMHAMCEIVFCE